MVQYFAIAENFDEDTLPELNSHFCKLAERKKESALRFMDHSSGHGIPVMIAEIPAPKTQFSSTQEIIEWGVRKETEAIERFEAIATLAKEEGDHETEDFIEEILGEEAEDLSLMKELLGVVHSAGEDNLLVVEDYLLKKTSVAEL
jgi:ferritin